MKLLALNSALALSLVSTIGLAKTQYEPGKYSIDPSHSHIGFEVPHLVISSVEGKFTEFSGTIQLKENLSLSSVDVDIKTNSIDTGTQKRDDHLRSADFFEVEKFPKITFKSTAVKGNLKSLRITGDLTIKGTTKKVTLTGKYLGSVTDGYGNKKVAFDLNTEINRKDFGLNWSSMVEAGPVVGDDVTINLKIQAAQNK